MHSLARNISAPVWERMRTRFGLLDTRRELAVAEDYRTKLAIRTPAMCCSWSPT